MEVTDRVRTVEPCWLGVNATWIGLKTGLAPDGRPVMEKDTVPVKVGFGFRFTLTLPLEP